MSAGNSINTPKGEVYTPSADVIAQANVRDPEALRKEASENIEAYWARRAEELTWFKKWDRVLDDSNKPFFKWFVGGKTNIVANAIDRHVRTWRRNKLALIWESEKGDVRTFSYHALAREVCKFSNVLKSMGVTKGDRVTIYMPRIPETVIAMLATAKIGAVHSVVYGGFSVEALHGRIEDSESKVIVTADGGYMNGKVIELKKIVDEALRRTAAPENVVVIRNTGKEVSMEAGRDYWYHDLMSMPLVRTSQRCETEEMDAEDPLYILYTSGTTGKPKAILHTHGGYQVGVYATFKDVFDIKEEDRWWCTADPGWVTGHSYIVYAPLIAGATSVMYEGAPTFPFPDRWWSIVEKYGVSVMYTTPTAIRGLMRFGHQWPNRHDLSSLRLLGSVGEPINPEAWRWFHKNIGKEKCPIMDTWWQTETGSFMISPLPTAPLKPGSATKPLPGIRADVVDMDGKPVSPGKGGFLIITTPWPSMLRTLYKDPERYVKTYWEVIPGGVYCPGDIARKDEDGYLWIQGRADDVLKIAGHRVGTSEVESAFVSHAAVSEAAVIGKPDPIRNEVIKAFLILKEGRTGDADVMEELKKHVRHELGPVAVVGEIVFVQSLPKTRSGKIMRRVLKARELGIDAGDVTTLVE